MKLCLAGNLSRHAFSAVESYPDNSLCMLQSFIDYQKTHGNIKLILKKCEFFLLDSGAFSMVYGDKKGFDINVYLDKYIAFINKYDIKHFIELDIYSIIGIPETEKLRKRLEKKTGKKCIPVFQKICGYKYYLNLIDEYDYIAIGGIAIPGRSGYNDQIFNRLLKDAKDNDCKIHGLGFTSLKSLPKLPFFSVDSTSWLSPLRYGAYLDKFNGTTIVKIKSPQGARMLKEARGHQFKEWIKFQKYAERFF